MKLTFDPAKDALNVKKHGISLSQAESADWADALEWVDLRFDYGEQRMASLVPLDGRIYFVAFVDRAVTRRVISLRKANIREVKRYAQNH